MRRDFGGNIRSVPQSITKESAFRQEKLALFLLLFGLVCAIMIQYDINMA